MMVMLTLLCIFYLVTASLLIHGARKVILMIIMTSYSTYMIIMKIIDIIVNCGQHKPNSLITIIN